MEELKSFIQQEIMNLAFVNVQCNESLIKSKILDSISVVEFMVAIEEKIGKKFPQHLVHEDNFDSIDIICQTIDKIGE